MRKLLALLLLLSSSALADSGSLAFPTLTADPSCASGQYFIYTNSTTQTIKMCQNGTLSNLGTSSYTGTAAGVGGNQYDPDRAGGGTLDTNCSDEFDASDNGNWTWRNQGTATWSTPSGADYGVLTTTQTNSSRWRSCNQSNTNPWTMTMKFSWYDTGTSGSTNGTGMAGMFGVNLGSCAAPTNAVNAILGHAVQRVNTSPHFGVILNSTGTAYTGQTGGVSGGGSDNANIGLTGYVGEAWYLQVRYVPSSKQWTSLESHDGRNWSNFASNVMTFTNNPFCIGFYISQNAAVTHTMKIQWIRVRTDSAATSGEYLVGQ